MKIQIVVWLLILMLIPSQYGCRKWQIKQKQKKQAREVEARKKKQEEEAMAKYQEALKRHASIQSASTKRAMKEQYKKSYRNKTGQKEFFLKRWFRKGHDTAPVKPE